MKCHALFLRDGLDQGDEKTKTTTVQPFVDGRIDESVVEWYEIDASPIISNKCRLSHHGSEKKENPESCTTTSFVNKGFVALKLQDYFGVNEVVENMNIDDNVIRSGVESFWKSTEGMTLLNSRFPSNDNLSVLPTHITRRKVPPDGMTLVHIDYPPSHDLLTLSTEWWSRWKQIFLKHELICGHERIQEIMKDDKDFDPQTLSNFFDLVGVVTVWICLQPKGKPIANYPLLVADASTVCKENTRIYKVGKKHSVGATFSKSMKWYHVQEMVMGDVWLFDTMQCPHVSVDLKTTSDAVGFERISAEIRCLVLKNK
mmetsp:Transcript_19566/g.22672  ORF Transcript_19566/g.22672 Transcript_19566/m.22672 type:complete len:315 (+) Transcript_19566:62-1006(+)